MQVTAAVTALSAIVAILVQSHGLRALRVKKLPDMTEKKRFEPSKFVTDDATPAKAEWHNMRNYEKVDCDVNTVAIGLCSVCTAFVQCPHALIFAFANCPQRSQIRR